MVYIILGVFNPNLELVKRQLASVLQQTYARFEVLLVCDGPQDDAVDALITTFDEERFVLLKYENTLGVHSNFARGLNAALTRSTQDDDLFAFCDQDDIWHPEKLARQVEVIVQNPLSSLCHCDARVVDDRGRTIAQSMFSYEARSKSSSLFELLITNSITGMTLMVPKAVASLARSFPMQDAAGMLHDHWVSMVAAAHGPVTFIDDVLVDYVQHEGNQKGITLPPPWGLPLKNVLFGGKAYWQRCQHQYALRLQAFEALSRAVGLTKNIRAADPRGGMGAVRLAQRMLLAKFTGSHGQAAQCWRLLAGKLLSAVG